MLFCISGGSDHASARDRTCCLRNGRSQRILEAPDCKNLAALFSSDGPAVLLNWWLEGTRIDQPMALTIFTILAMVLPGYADRPLFIGQTWSIAMEESFYILYPLMMRRLAKQALMAALVAVIFSDELFTILGRVVCDGAASAAASADLAGLRCSTGQSPSAV